MLISITQTVLLEKQAATLSPALFQHTSKMPPLPRYVLTRLPSLTDQICRQRSKEPLAKYSPFGLNETEYTGSVCFVRLYIHTPRSTSHSLIDASKEALARIRVREAAGLHLIV